MKKYRLIIKGNDTYTASRFLDAQSFSEAYFIAVQNKEALQTTTLEQLRIVEISEL